VNRVEIQGGLVRTPELRYLPSGTALMEMNVAVNGARYDSQARQQVVDTVYVAVQVWGHQAEELDQLGLSRGEEVYVLGRLDQRTIEKRDGTREQKTRVSATFVTVTRRKPSNPTPSGDGPRYADDEEPF